MNMLHGADGQQIQQCNAELRKSGTSTSAVKNIETVKKNRAFVAEGSIYSDLSMTSLARRSSTLETSSTHFPS